MFGECASPVVVLLVSTTKLALFIAERKLSEVESVYIQR